MTYLKELTLVAKEADLKNNPFAKAKAKLLTNLNTQLMAAQAMVKGEVFTVPKMKTVEESGEKIRKEVQALVRKWYWRDAEGKVRFAVRVSNKVLEVQKGKTDFVVNDDKELPNLIELLINAVKAGELDSQIKTRVEAK